MSIPTYEHWFINFQIPKVIEMTRVMLKYSHVTVVIILLKLVKIMNYKKVGSFGWKLLQKGGLDKMLY